MSIISRETNCINSDQTPFLMLWSAVQECLPHVQWKSEDERVTAKYVVVYM